VYIGRRRGTLSAARASTLLENLRKVPGAVQQVLDTEADIEAIATEYADSDAFFLLAERLPIRSHSKARSN